MLKGISGLAQLAVYDRSNVLVGKEGTTEVMTKTNEMIRYRADRDRDRQTWKGVEGGKVELVSHVDDDSSPAHRSCLTCIASSRAYHSTCSMSQRMILIPQARML
jgi:hypothetical protein